MTMKYYTEIVPFELAKKLKEAGYNEECSGHYAKDGHLWETYPKQNSNDAENFFSAPTYAEVFDWLMARENIYCDRHTFHKAANAAIEKACEILKKNG